MYSKPQYVTPDQAREWLDTKNKKNRPLSERTVARYTQEMKAGRWKLNGEAIIFGKSGNLLNGQHRLEACCRAQRDFQTIITMGVDDDAFDTLDDGHTRQLKDVLAIKGEHHAANVSAALSFVWQYATGNMLRGNKTTYVSTKQILEKMLENHPGIRKSARFHAMLKARPGGLLLPPSLVIGLHYIFTLIDEKKADQFFTQFQSGLELVEGNPILYLRQRLISGGRDVVNKMRTDAQYAYTVKAWNLYAGDKKVNRQAIVFQPDKEVMPEINGVPKSLMKDLL